MQTILHLKIIYFETNGALNSNFIINSCKIDVVLIISY